MKKRLISTIFSLQNLLYASLAILSVFYGVYAHKHHHFIAVVMEDALETSITLFKKPWYYIDATGKNMVETLDNDNIQAGLTKLVHFSGDKKLAVSVIKNDGTLVHQWPIDWFTIWPDAAHLSYFMQPKSPPGTMVHGAEILPDGDLVFNFEYLGMVRLDICGKVIWRLPYQTHHSVFIDDNGFIWTAANKVRKQDSLRQSLHEPYYVEPFILKITPGGKVDTEKSVFDIIATNDLYGALYQSSIDNEDPVVRGDTLHVNDVKTFPASMKPGFLKPGDIMVSLRNINAIWIIEPDTWKIKHSINNVTVRQHDPDFIDGNTISVYDNNNRFYKDDPAAYSRIMAITIPGNTVRVLFAGNRQQPFFSKILGKHQQLDNGNYLVTEGRNGRAFEITPDGHLAWEYINLIGHDTAAVIQEAQRLPAGMNEQFFREKARACKKAGESS